MQTITGNDLEQSLIQARKKSMSLFSDIEHRLEPVRTLNEVEFINDSKATDIDSSGYSLDMMEKPVIWIIGESDEDTDYELLVDEVADKVRILVVFGNPSRKALESIIRLVDIYKVAETVQDAVEVAHELALQGEVVLFSPACSSFAQFDNYRDRGITFRDAVNSLKAKGN